MAWPAGTPSLNASLAAVAFIANVLQLGHGGLVPADGIDASLDVNGVVLAAAATLPILGCWRFPAAAFVATGAGAALMAVLDYPIDLAAGPTVLLYLIAAGRDGISRWSGRLTVLVFAMFTAYGIAIAVSDSAVPNTALVHTGLACAAAWFAGDRTRLRRQRMTQLHQRALRAEQEVARERRLAVA
ncbi:MAG TPA: hypothetical protein VFO77_08475, partial [Actinoplanes sp.]|nr:hypothetical protein [Actinoplanes sp.]